MSCTQQAQALLDEAAKVKDETGDLAEMIGLYERAVRADGRCLPALMALAEAYGLAERFDEEVKVLEQARVLAPDRAEIILMLFPALFYAGRYQEAIAVGTEHNTLIGSYNLGFLGYYMGMSYARLGDLAEAVRWLESGLLYDRSGFSGTIEAELIDIYKQALAKSYTTEVALKLSRLMIGREQFADALGVLADLIRRSPDVAVAYFLSGVAHAELANRTEGETRQAHVQGAVAALRRYLELAPTGEFAQKAREMLQNLGQR